jgi:hypothetical protein
LPDIARSTSARLGAVVGGAHLRVAGEHLGDGRGGVGRDVEIVRQVALRVEVEREHVEVEPAQDVGQRAHRRGLAGAALERENGDGVGHGGRGR